MTANAEGPVQLIRPEEIQAHKDQSVNCARCARLGNFRADVQAGWCMRYRHMQSTWHPVLCPAFEPKA